MSEPCCERCGDEYCLRDGYDPSPYCDECAQAVIKDIKEIIPDPAAFVARARAMEEALVGLVEINQAWNADVTKIIGRPLNWTDSYLNAARAALALPGGEKK